MTSDVGAFRRLGLMGGTFDPPHVGHLIAAQEAAVVLELDHVLFVPAGIQPLKQGGAVTSAEHRLRMVELAIGENALFRISRVDVDRPGPSFTVDLLSIFKQQLGGSTDLYFIVGADSLQDLRDWKEPERILELAYLVVLSRPGQPFEERSAFEQSLRRSEERIIRLHVPAVDVSSTELRQRVREGRTIRYLVPDAVQQFIRLHRLYRD